MRSSGYGGVDLFDVGLATDVERLSLFDCWWPVRIFSKGVFPHLTRRGRAPSLARIGAVRHDLDVYAWEAV